MSNAEDNYKRLRAELDELLSKDKRLAAIAEKITRGKATFKDSARYTQIVSRHMSDVIKRNIGDIKVPMGKEMVCRELLRDHYELINGIFGDVQVSVDEKLGIHLKPVKPAYPAERVDSWAHSLEDPTVEQSVIERRAASGSENIGNSMHDDCIKENAKWREQAGLDTYLVRDAGGGCCKWCAALEGRYRYADAPDDVFKRHDNCTCTVTYECGRKRQDVWSKKTWEVSDEELNARKEASENSKPKVFRNGELKELSDSAKPKVFTPAEAKELEQKALAEHPIMKNTSEQAKALEAKILGTNDKKDSVDTSSEVVASQINDWERQNYSNKTEKGLLILPDGTTKDFGGIEHHVTGKEEDIKLMNGAVFTHNHPTDNTFSTNDIATGLVKGNLKEMRAVTSTGDVHILVNNGATEQQRKKFNVDYQQRRMKAANTADAKIRRGEKINKDEYVKARLENFMQERANDYNLSYTKSNINEMSIDNGAKSGIIKEKDNSALVVDMQFFANKNIPKMESQQLSKSIKSWNEQIEIHKNKIAAPEKYHENWDKLDERYKNGLKKHWEHEIKVFSNDIQEATDELKKRGE